MTAPDTVVCAGCRRQLPRADATLMPSDIEAPTPAPVWQCPECRGLYWVTRRVGRTFEPVGTPAFEAFGAMLAWWDALADRDGADMQLSWTPLGADMLAAGDPVVLASTDLERDGISREGRVRLANALPPAELLWPVWWHPQEPLTWWLWDEVPFLVGISERHGPRVQLREVWSRATDYGDPGDPDMYGAGPHRASATVAAAWWFAMLQPIHLARVALLRAGADGAGRVRLSARDRATLATPATVSDPGFADALRARADVSRRILVALGWPLPPE